jgi:hypothetical protein
MSPLLRELLAAHRSARLPELAAALQACGLPIDTGPIWGVAFVEIDPHHYSPVAGGKPAIIAPLFEGGVLLDLVATGLETRTTRTRYALADVPGIACESEFLAKQVDRAMRQPVRLPKLFVREADRAVA